MIGSVAQLATFNACVAAKIGGVPDPGIESFIFSKIKNELGL